MLLGLFFLFGLFFVNFSRYFWHLLSCLFLVLTFLFIFYFNFSMVPHLYVFGFFSLDVLSLTLVVLSFWLSSLMLLASYNILLNGISSKNFCVCILSLCLCLYFCFIFSNFFLFYVFFEFRLVPTFFLIIG